MCADKLEPQQLFADRYQVERLLGSGAMGEVYLAKDSLLEDEIVALKLLNSSGVDLEQHRERFLREVKLARKVSSPYVVKTFDFGIEGEQLYFTMEYVAGQTLKELLVSAGRLSEAKALPLLHDVSAGLQAIHLHGVVHRDLKPANIILSESGEAKIVDFGVARPPRSDLTEHDEVVGSAAYLAPEAWTGNNIGSYSDLYALGVIAFEMLEGRLPFDANSPAQMMWLHMEGPVPPMAQDTSPLLKELVRALLEKDPDKRPCRADEIAQFLSNREMNSDALHRGSQFATVTRSSQDQFFEARSSTGIDGGYVPSSRITDDGEEEFGVGAALQSNELTQRDARDTSLREFQPLNFSQSEAIRLTTRSSEKKRPFLLTALRELFALALPLVLLFLLAIPTILGSSWLDLPFGRYQSQQVLCAILYAIPFALAAVAPCLFLQALSGVGPARQFETLLRGLIIALITILLFTAIELIAYGAYSGGETWEFERSMKSVIRDYRQFLKVLLFMEPGKRWFMSIEDVQRFVGLFAQFIFIFVLATAVSKRELDHDESFAFKRRFVLFGASLAMMATFLPDLIVVFTGRDFVGEVYIRLLGMKFEVRRQALLWSMSIYTMLAFYCLIARLYTTPRVVNERLPSFADTTR